MKKLLTVALLICSVSAFTQGVQKQEKIAGLNAFTYYPDGYDSGAKFPLILFFPGLGQAGTIASKLLVYGPSKFVTQNPVPAVVISVQPTYGWVTEHIIDKVLTEIISKYRIDTNSIHLTGLSAGANGIEKFALTPSYASRISSIVSLSAPEVPEYHKYIPEAVKKGVAWLGFCGNKDSNYDKMKALFDKLNTVSAGTGMFVAGDYGHCCYNDIYNPAYKIPGLNVNIYNWMLNQRDAVLPVDTSTRVIQILHDPSRVAKIIVLDKDNKATVYDSASYTTPYLKITVR